VSSLRGSSWSPEAIQQLVVTLVVPLGGLLLVLAQQQRWLPKDVDPYAFFLTPAWLYWFYTRAEIHSDGLYKWRVGVLARAFNPTVNWSAQFVLYDVANPGVVEQLRDWIWNNYDRSDLTPIATSDHSFSISLRPIGSIIVERTSQQALSTTLSADEPTPGDSLLIDCPHLSSGYRDALGVTEQNLLPLVQQAGRLARTTNGTFTLVARFEKNPYYGLYVRNVRALGPTNVRFSVEFHETIHGSKQDVVVSQNKLEIASHDFGGFQTLVQRYLAVI